MSFWSSRPKLRWLVPGLATLLVVGGGATATAIASATDPPLPPRNAAELLVDLQTAEVDGFSGTLVHRAELGLPPLPVNHDYAPLFALLSGSNTLRVWYAGADQFRVALLRTLGQSDIICNGTDVWTWDSHQNQATHLVLPRSAPTGRVPATVVTPQQAAELALGALDPTTEVTTESTAKVAGRAAYELVLTPRDDATLITSIRLAIDAEHHLPLRVQLYGSEPDPAFEVRFTQISFARPDQEQFRFNPPPGVTVAEQDLLALLGFAEELPAPPSKVIGSGWTSVLVARMPTGDGIPAWSELPLLAGLPEVHGAWGSGRLLAGTVFSLLLTKDGRMLVGAVTPDRLTEVAADPAAKLAEPE